MTDTKNPEHWTNDWLVFASPQDRLSLAIVRDAKSGSDALTKYNKRRNITPRAKHAVRIQTFEGTLHHLISLRDPVTLRWARDGKTEGAAMAREIAKELRVKLPPKRKVTAGKAGE